MPRIYRMASFVVTALVVPLMTASVPLALAT